MEKSILFNAARAALNAAGEQRKQLALPPAHPAAAATTRCGPVAPKGRAARGNRGQRRLALLADFSRWPAGHRCRSGAIECGGG